MLRCLARRELAEKGEQHGEGPYRPSVDPCRPHSVIATEQIATAYAPPGGLADGRTSLTPTCSIDDAGILTMTFLPPACTDSAHGWYAGCVFAANQDLSGFDSSGGGRGLLAVEVCVQDFVRSSLNLRYGSTATTMVGATKYLPVIDAAEDFSGTGCRLVYLAPGDACYAYNRCGADAGCATVDGGVSCDFFDSSHLTLMDEFCVQSTTIPALPVVVRLKKVMLSGPACVCADDSRCSSPNVCRRDGWGPRAQCVLAGDRCPGLCSP